MPKCKLFDITIIGAKLPAPFDDPSVQQTRSDVYSKYNNSMGHKAELFANALTALKKYAELVEACENSAYTAAMGAVGFQGENYVVAEYPDGGCTGAVVFNRNTGKFTVSNLDSAGGTLRAYTLSAKEMDGSALIFALMPVLMEDDEFTEAFNEFRGFSKNSFTDIEASSKAASMLCDNMFRRIENAIALKDAGVKITIPGTGNLPQLTEHALKSNVYSPDKALYGEFTIFEIGSTPAASYSAVSHNAFVGKYQMSSRNLTPEEQRLIPELPSWYVIPKEVVRVCEHLQKTTGAASPIRNIMLRGPAGTGKTESAKAIAAGLGLPYLFLTCSANTEVYDLLGQILPKMSTDKTLDAINGLPSMEDIRMDPATAYCEMTGSYREGITEDEVLSKMIELAAAKNNEAPHENSFVYVETPLIKALRYGYVIEIQEPTVIANPGVLVGLNSLLDNCKSVTLPNGERVERHPETVIVVTTNTSYEGCKDMNQSVISRMNLVLDIDAPDVATTVKRVMGITGCSDKTMVSMMAEVVRDISIHCQETMITDGSCGIRELLAWVQSYMIISDPYESALYTVISSASGDPENREELITTCLAPKFTRKV